MQHKPSLTTPSDLSGRLRLVYETFLREDTGLTLDIGSRRVRQGDITIDIMRAFRPDVVADVRWLPFRDRAFDTVVMTDVIEHIPVNNELIALKQIRRVLRNNGRLILSTPNHNPLYVLLDPAFLLKGHRHYNFRGITEIVSSAGFVVKRSFASGGFWEALWVTYYSVISYSTGIDIPKILNVQVDKQYDGPRRFGYTIFIEAFKEV